MKADAVVSSVDVERANTELAQLGARAAVCVKRVPRGRWETVEKGLTRFDDALARARDLQPQYHEVAVFVDGTPLGGMMIWSSAYSPAVNSLTTVAP